MDFDITTSVDNDILFVVFRGKVTELNARAVVERYFEQTRPFAQTKFLVDARELEGRLSLGRTYFLIRDLPERVPPDRKTAFVENVKYRDMAEFLEVALKNVGINLQHFFDFEEALDWLRSQ